MNTQAVFGVAKNNMEPAKCVPVSSASFAAVLSIEPEEKLYESGAVSTNSAAAALVMSFSMSGMPSVSSSVATALGLATAPPAFVGSIEEKRFARNA